MLEIVLAGMSLCCVVNDCASGSAARTAAGVSSVVAVVAAGAVVFDVAVLAVVTVLALDVVVVALLVAGSLEEQAEPSAVSEPRSAVAMILFMCRVSFC